MGLVRCGAAALQIEEEQQKTEEAGTRLQVKGIKISISVPSSGGGGVCFEYVFSFL